jgi:G2/mitotic-specific cyclin 1/2
MVDYLHRPVSHEAFFKKYASKKFLKGKQTSSYLRVTSLTACVASILTRQWAKKYHHLYVDSSEPYSHAKDEQ